MDYNTNKFWWEVTGAPHSEIMSFVSALDDEQGYRKEDNLNSLRLFGNSDTVGLSLGEYSKRNVQKDGSPSLNIVHSMCTTVTSRITKSRPKATFLTSGGNWSAKRKAKLLDKFVSGQFYETDIYTIAPRIFLDATVFGTGIMKIYEVGGKVKIDRIFPNEVIVDDTEALYGEPRQIFQRKFVSRRVLSSLYPEVKQQIMDNDVKSDSYGNERNTSNEQIECVEAWHLPSGEGAEDGRHVICLDNVTLLDEPYTKSYFPFVFLKWTDRLLGFWGQGLAEQLSGIQSEINKLLLQIKLQMTLATPKVFVEVGSKISKAHINNETWGIIEYSGTKPDFHVPMTTSPEIFSHLDRLYRRAYEIAGVSELAAQSRKPGGLDSGRALREFHDIESERFMVIGREYEGMFMEAARQMVDIARDVSSRDGDDYKVLSHNNREIELVTWGKINLDSDSYVMRIYPTSLLPATPAGRLATVEGLFQSGLIDRNAALALLDYPDLEAYHKVELAFIDDVDLLIENMLEKGIYSPPEPFSNLQFAIQRIQSAYIRAKVDGAPDGRLDLLRRYIESAVLLLQGAQQYTQAQQQQSALAEQAQGKQMNAESSQMAEQAAPQELMPQ
jgi:hypothetical protein